MTIDELIQQYHLTRDYTLALVSDLSPEDFIPQAAVFTSPVKWHIAHTTWFFEKMILEVFATDYIVFDSTYNFLFNSYYNSLGKRIERSQRGLITRPTITTIIEYRKYVDNHINTLLEKTSNKKIEALIILGINHEQQHQELILSDLKYTFWCNPTYPKLNENHYLNEKNKKNNWLTIDEGIYEIGYQSNGFSFDNEHGVHKQYLHSFEIANELITNGEYLDFINDGGYNKSELWLDEGWYWIQREQIKHPLYWIFDNTTGEWKQYTLSGLLTINKESILCHISFYEANAFAIWKGCRLPTEFEWEVASDSINWGTRWEWTNSAYLPYPNYKIADGAIGEYNGKFMSNQMVLRGASIATPEGHSRKTYRNFFPSDTRWQYSGIRLIKNI